MISNNLALVILMLGGAAIWGLTRIVIEALRTQRAADADATDSPKYASMEVVNFVQSLYHSRSKLEHDADEFMLSSPTRSREARSRSEALSTLIQKIENGEIRSVAEGKVWLHANYR